MAATVKVEEQQWIWSGERMKRKKIKYAPGLYKIFDQILVRAAETNGVKDIEVTIHATDNTISVRTNFEPGRVPKVKIDDNFREAISCSTKFTIKRANGKHLTKKVFTPDINKPTPHKYKSDGNYTMVSFEPDLPKFSMQCLEDDIVALMKRRVVDLAGCSRNGVKVQLDATSVLPETFEDYVNLYLQTSTTHTTRIYEKVNDRWEICVAIANGHFELFQQVSFVNNIATMKGGSHVDYITSQITTYVADFVDLLPNDIESYLWVFVNAYIDDPTFDSLTKENLITNERNFKSTCQLTHEFLYKIAGSLADSDLFKSNNVGELDIPELQDAVLASTPDSEHCTLILTKGECATAYAMSRLSLVGQDNYGVFPLRGKLLNVREASPEDLKKNTEMQNIKKILGLEDDKIYDNVETLRYQHLMIMVDEDHDGLEIKGLLINFLHCFWPSLLKVENFLHAFIAPVVKAYHKKTYKVFLFYTMPEYYEWKGKISENEYIIKVYKGVKGEGGGESSFPGLDQQQIKKFVWVNNEDDEAIVHAFSNMNIEALETPEDGTDFDTKEKCIRYLDFINKEFKPYALSDLKRSVPSIFDGLIPCQRTILFYAFSKPIIEEIGVVQFTNYVFEHCSYHDEGKESLVGTVIGMAQNYVGSNNINLLQPNGEFGTRVMGGKDHTSGRWLFTQLSPITRSIFLVDDDPLLNYLIEDGESIGPEWFIPIIPMVLVNGSEVRGAAWSSFIPNYHPREIIANLERLLEGKTMKAMDPWYKGFNGHIEKKASEDSYVTKGIFEVKNDKNALSITELPVMSWTEDYEEFLKTTSLAYKDYSDDTNVHFEITMTEDHMNNRSRKKSLKVLSNDFKLTTTLSTANMYLLNEKGELKKYDTPEQILQEFYRARLGFYKKRRIPLLRKLKKDSLLLENKVKFIKEFWEGNLVFKNRNLMCANFKEKGLESLPSIECKVEEVLLKEADMKAGEEKPQGNASDMVPGTEYDYLLSMPAALMKEEDLNELQKEMEAKKNKFWVLLTMTDFKESWRHHLRVLDEQLADEYPLVEKKAERARNAAGGRENKKRRMQ